jgi:hypothetical protein
MTPVETVQMVLAVTELAPEAVRSALVAAQVEQAVTAASSPVAQDAAPVADEVAAAPEAD